MFYKSTKLLLHLLNQLPESKWHPITSSEPNGHQPAFRIFVRRNIYNGRNIILSVRRIFSSAVCQPDVNIITFLVHKDFFLIKLYAFLKILLKNFLTEILETYRSNIGGFSPKSRKVYISKNCFSFFLLKVLQNT